MTQQPTELNYAKSAAKALGAIQIVCGILCILTQVAEIVVFIMFVGVASTTTPGIWNGIIFLIAGSFGVSSSKDASRCKVTTTMVMSIISAILCWCPAIPLAALNITAGSIYGFVSILGTLAITNAIVLVLCLLEFGVAIGSIVVAARAVCNCCGAQPQVTTTVTYTQGGPPAYTGGQGYPMQQPGMGQNNMAYNQKI